MARRTLPGALAAVPQADGAMTRYWGGIDPGKSGGMARVFENGAADAEPLPWLDAMTLDVAAMLAFMAAPDGVLQGVAIERVSATEHMGRVSAFKFGACFGQLIGASAACLWPHELITSRKWQQLVLGHFPKGQSKAASVAHVRRVYPSVDLTPGRKRKPHDGMSDAVCIAEWCKLHSPLRVGSA